MLQQNYLQLVKELTTTLDFFDYTLLTPGITSHFLPVIKLAIRSKERENFQQKLAEKIDFQVVQSKLDTTILTVDLGATQFLTIELYHFFHEDRLIYLNIEEVLANKKQSEKGLFIPKLEHLLEFSILNSFFHEEGLSDKIIKRFEDLHIFLQEGLLESFNTKYDTYFNSLYDLSDYKEMMGNHFRKQLKQFPVNKFANRVKLGWVNMKRLLKRSAVFSYFF